MARTEIEEQDVTGKIRDQHMAGTADDEDPPFEGTHTTSTEDTGGPDTES